jgi:hypothetical protein
MVSVRAMWATTCEQRAPIVNTKIQSTHLAEDWTPASGFRLKNGIVWTGESSASSSADSPPPRAPLPIYSPHAVHRPRTSGPPCSHQLRRRAQRLRHRRHSRPTGAHQPAHAPARSPSPRQLADHRHYPTKTRFGAGCHASGPTTDRHLRRVVTP